MATRWEQITELFKQTAREVTTTPASWRAFLTSACRNYRLPFDEQLLIYAQRPDATAVLEMERWNQRFGRWVNRGAKGIAVFDREHPNRLRYYFDVADTHETRMSRPVPLWQVRPEYEQDVVETLENSFGELEHREDLGDALLSAARNAVEDNMGDYLGELEQLTQGSLLEELDGDNLALQFRTVLGNSVAAMLLARCGIDPAGYLEDEDFQEIGNFNTPETRNALGVATRDIARMCLDEIARTVLPLERQIQKDNRTFANSPTRLYAEAREPENSPERSPHDGSDLHHAGGLPASQPTAAPGGASAHGQIRPDTETLFAGASENYVHQPADQRQAEQPSGGDSADRPAPDGGNRGADGESRGRDGGTESQRSDEVGADDEQPAERGGGNGAGGADLQLTTQEPEPEESAGGEQLPALLDEKQIMAIIANKDDDLKYKKNQIELFFSVHSDVQERAEYLRSAYQDRYTEIIADGQRLGYKPQENGLLMWEGSYPSRTRESVFSWDIVAQWTAQLIDKKEYFIQTDIPQLPTQESQQMSLFDFAAFQQPAQAEGTAQPSIFPHPALPQQVIDEALCIGANDQNSRLIICAYFKKDKPDNARFLSEHYGENGAGFYLDGRQYAIWYNAEGIRIAQGESAQRSSATLIPWEQAAARIRELLDLGRYMPQSELDRVDHYEINVLADRLLMMFRDIEDEDKRFFPSLRAAYDKPKGFPEAVEEIAGLLSREDGLQTIISEYKTFAAAYQENPDIMRFRFYRPQKLLEQLSDLQREPLHFTAAEGYDPQRRFFISGDEINNLLRGGKRSTDYRLAVYSFYRNHTERKERVDFLKHYHGEYSGHSSGNDDVTYQLSKGVSFSHGSITAPYAKVELKWPAVEKRVSAMIAQGRFLTDEDRAAMPQYEKHQLARNIRAFFENVPQEQPHPYPFGFDYWDAVKLIEPQLDDPASVEEIYQMMVPIWEATPQDDRMYALRRQAFENLAAFRQGTFTLFAEHKEPVAPAMPQAKAYDLGYGHLGNGLTVWNRLEEEHGDYKTVAHIAPDRTVTIYDEEMPQAVREEIQWIADTSEMTISATQDAPVFAVPPRVQGPPQKEELADPYPELAAQVLRFVGEFDGSRMGYGEDDAQAVENIAQQLHDPVQREEIRRLLQSFLDHADPEEEIAVDITLCMEQIAELPPALTPEQAQIEEIAGYLEEAGYAVSSELVEEGLMDYRAHGGKGNSQDVADFIERGFLSEEPEPASLEIAKEFINDFCVAEYGSPADFSDLEKVGIAYTTVTDEEIPIQVNADLVHYRIERYLDGQFLERRQYESLDELIQNELAELDFDDLISVSDEELESISTTPEQDSDDYRLLSRLKADCDYFLGAGGRAEKHLWAGNVREQIAKMRELYAALPDEPEWLTMEDIDRYAQRMEPPYEVVVYHHFENGVDERLDYQTLAEAEQAAQKYVAGTMEGEDGFAYDGAGIYDLQENRWLRVYGNFPDKRAIAEASRVLPDDRQEKTGPVLMSIEDPAPYEDLVGKELTIDGHRFVVERVSDLTGDVALRDVTFEESQGFPLDRMEKIDRVRQLIVEQEEPVKQRSTVIDLTAPVREEEAPTQKEELPTPPSARRARVSPTVLHPEIPPEQRRNFRITDGHLGEGGAKTKFHNNVAAIQTLRKIESEGRLATPEEQEILSRYVGWGGLPQAFDGNNPQWAEEFTQLQKLLSPEEYEAAKATTLNAHYTSPTVIKAIYQAVENMGFRAGNILEPSCGIGNFFGLVPESMTESKLYGVELDPLTGRIAQQLYQQSSIAVQGFENTELPDSFFDLAIGNVPFGSYTLHDKRYDKHHFLIHDYFFAKTLDKVRPGGIVAFITSKGTLDKQNPSVRKYIAERAELIGAIRLPNNAFLANAGTQVTTDILFLQKREKLVDVSTPAPDSGLEWLHLVQTEDGVPINQYFLEHPEMMLGQMAFDRSMYGNAKETTCKPLEGESLSDLLAKAVGNLHAQYTPYEIEEREDEEDRSIPADPTVRNFSYTVVDGVIYYREDSRMFPVEVSVTAENRIRGMIELRDCARSLIEVQMENGSEEAVQEGQRELNRLYDSFTAQYGLLNSRANTSVFSSDSSFPLLCSLEILDEQGNLKRKADLFTKRTIQPYRAVTHVDTAPEALAVSLGEKARVDLEYMGSLTGKTQEQLAEELRGVIFPVPGEVETNGKPHYVTADEYLSGNVREKLKTARQAAEQNPSFAVNVQALEKVQPKDLTAGEISVRLGAAWIPEDVAEQFTHELLQTPFYYKSRIRVQYSPVTGEWNVSEKSLDRSNIRVSSTYGTKRVSAYKIIEDTLNLRDVRVFDTVQDENGKDQRMLNKKETAIAQDKQDQIKEKFQEWVWADPARRERLCTLYNEKFNAIRPREYDGSHLVFAGMNPEITLRPHQRNAVARAIYGGNALFAHVVGAGKTYEMIATAMESKRLGLSSKALFVVPNHIIGDFASDFLDLYPGANILVATKRDFEKQRRKKFCARIATGDYDGIILGHSQFEKIPLSPERQQAMLKRQIAEVVAGIETAKKQEGSRFTVKQMEKSKKSLEAKLKKLNDQSAKDDVVTFEELGVDRLFIDEADLFKNLYLYTKMRNVGGISQTESQKASDLYMKCQYMDERTGGKGVVFATGTPVSNSMAELYTMQRYLQGNLLKELGLSHFDAWASQFGETVTSMELKPEGQGFQQKTRFSNFYNLPELMALFKEVADIQTADMLNLPVPKAKYETVVCKPSDIQKEMVEALGQRADAVRCGAVDASKDNMLLITNDGRKLALDQRLLNPLLPDVEGSKVNVCAEKVYRIWKDTQKDRLTQLVFCDLSTPKSDGTFSVYNDLKDKLVGCGIPEEEIAFVHSAANETQKQQLFGKVRAGQVRVLMGSTAKMGAGTNVQDKLITLHDLDCPWRPRDLEQRSGRIIRQGNQNPEVQIYRYVTEGTFDSYLYQMVENKQRFISQVFTSKAPARVMQEIDDVVLSYNEIKALATGNPQIIERANLETEVNKLKMLRASFLSQKYELEDKVLKYYPKEIQQYEERIAGYTADIARRDKNTPTEGFAPMNVKEIACTEKSQAGQALLDACSQLENTGPVSIGSYRGFKMKLTYEAFSKEYQVSLKGALSHRVSLGTDVFGNITRLDNALNGLEQRLESNREALERTQEQMAAARTEAEKPFPREEELKEKSQRLAELTKLLKLDEKDRELLDTAPEEGEKAPIRKVVGRER